jgi:hypothetical protein
LMLYVTPQTNSKIYIFFKLNVFKH